MRFIQMLHQLFRVIGAWHVFKTRELAQDRCIRLSAMRLWNRAIPLSKRQRSFRYFGGNRDFLANDMPSLSGMVVFVELNRARLHPKMNVIAFWDMWMLLSASGIKDHALRAINEQSGVTTRAVLV